MPTDGERRGAAPATRARAARANGVVRFVAAYAIAAAAWILLSDRLVAVFFTDPDALAIVSLVKGWAFVAVSAAFFYVALRRTAARGDAALDDAAPAGRDTSFARRAFVLGLATLAIVGAGAGGIAYTGNRERAKVFDRLQAVADLRAQQLMHWVAERRGDASVAAADLTLARLAAEPDLERLPTEPAGDLRSRLLVHRGTLYEAAALVDADGATRLAVGDWAPRVGAPLRRALATAFAVGRAVDTDLYRADADGPVVYDLVVPVVRSAGLRRALVLRVAAEREIYPLLRNWPYPSSTAETHLFRRDGAEIVSLSPVRFRADSPLSLRAPVDQAGVVGPSVMSGTAPIGAPTEGLDYRGEPVLAWARPVQGTSWMLIAKIDRREVAAAARREAVWIGLVALLTLAAVAFAVQLLHEQQTLRLTRALKARQEESLRSTKLLADIADSSTDAIYAKDAQGRYLLMNAAALKMAGMTADDAVGRDDVELFGAEVATRIREADRRVMEGGEITTSEEPLDTPHGRIALLTTKAPLRDPEGRIVGVFGISRDVTERARVAAELARYRDHLEELVRQRTEQLETANRELERRTAEIADLYNRSPCGYDSVDPTGLILRMNDTELGWLGYAREEVVGVRRIQEFLAPELQARFADRLRVLEDGGELRDADAEFVRRDGTRMPVVVNATALRDAQGRIVEIRATVVDATERRAREREVARLNEELARRAADAEAASGAKSAFLANMSHEIRTPMNAIVGFTHILRRSTRDPQQRDRLEKIAAAADHLLSLINDVLDISKIEAGKLTLESAPVVVRDLMEQVRAWAADRAHEKGVQLSVETDAGVPDAVLGDATRLRQVLLNYASNAVKFTERGAITMRARVLQQDAATVLLRFEVEDTGLGVGEEARDRLFNAFEQADTSTTRRYGGTGLGLAINRLIAREMGGEVGVESVPGAGSRFWFTARLPKSVAAADGAAGGAAGGESLAVPEERVLRSWWLGRPLLLVEDNPINREVAEELLTAVGLAVEVAEDGAVAVDKARTGRYALILMDLQMPVMDGFDAARAIRALPEHATTPIVAMTAAATRADRDAALRAGMSDFISKPFKPGALWRTLMRWLPREPLEGRLPEAAPAAAVSAARPRAPADVLALLAHVHSLDLEQGLPYAGHDGVRYLALLRRLVASGQQAVRDCRERLAQDDVTGACRAMHSLKGASAFLGALRVRDLARELEERLPHAAPPEISARLAALERALGTLLEEVGAIEVVVGAPDPAGAAARAG